MDSNMIEKLKSMLDDPETVKALSDTINSIAPQGLGEATEYEASPTEDHITDATADNITGGVQDGGDIPHQDVFSTLKNTLAKSANMQDPRINLLYSLKPYLRPSRSAKMDQAIKLIQITKIASLLK